MSNQRRHSHQRHPYRNDFSYGFDMRNNQPLPPGVQYGQFPSLFYGFGVDNGSDRDFSHYRRDLSWDHENQLPEDTRNRFSSRHSPRSYKPKQRVPDSTRNPADKAANSLNAQAEPFFAGARPKTTVQNPDNHPSGNTVNPGKEKSSESNQPTDSSSNHPPPTSPVEVLDTLLARQKSLQEEITKHISGLNLTENDDVQEYLSRYNSKSTEGSGGPNTNTLTDDHNHHNYSNIMNKSKQGSVSSAEGSDSSRSTTTRQPDGAVGGDDFEQLPPGAVEQLSRIIKNCLDTKFPNNSSNGMGNQRPNNPPSGEEQEFQDDHVTPQRSKPRSVPQHKVDFRDTFTKYGIPNECTRTPQPGGPHCSTPSVPPTNLPGLDSDLISHVIVDAIQSHFRQSSSANHIPNQDRERNNQVPFGQPRDFNSHVPYNRDQDTGPHDHRSQMPNTFGNTYFQNVSRPQMVTTFSDTGLEKFTGKTKDYVDFKDLFNIVTEGYPEKYKLLKLRQYLDYKSNAEIAYIHADDEGALQQAWSDLDELYGQGRGNAEYHVAQVMAVMTWRPCETEADLERLYTHLKTHLAMAQRAGDHYRYQTEGLAHFMSNILYGWCQDKVIDLKLNNPSEFCMDNIMSYLKRAVQHDRQKSRETKNPFSRRQSSFYKRDNFERRDRSNSRDHSDKGHHYEQSHHSNPRNPLSGQRSPRRDQVSSNRNRSPQRSSHNSLRGRSNYSQSDNSDVQGAVCFNVNSNEDNPQIERRRSNSPHPRGARARSPARSPNRQNFRCFFCKNNEHHSMNCTNITSENALTTARADRLCFVCLTPGHTPIQCPMGLTCGSSACKNRDQRHSKLLCKAFQERD